ncbi:hypothetical protein [Pontibacter mangrovi]|uniref:Uncharacterized protein n=1 Tax=Pontibacter mangrovi TaxID=2589816 RepID=A0A501W5W1_9BACT|nr:hypothetical protein [Pontibacter mangrovi]TPE43690.1 hypothetical protein FJM65_13150 [Pontibacter mangrovi]
MKADKPIDEAIFRAHGATENELQPQDELYAMKTPQKHTPGNNLHGGAPLNESHINLMQSWQNLRGLDSKLANTKYTDLSEHHKPGKGQRRA